VKVALLHATRPLMTLFPISKLSIWTTINIVTRLPKPHVLFDRYGFGSP